MHVYIIYVLAVCSILIGMYHDSIVVLHDHLIMSVLLCTYITYCIYITVRYITYMIYHIGIKLCETIV